MIFAFFLGLPFTIWMVIIGILFLIDVTCFAFEKYTWSIIIMVGSILGAVWIDGHNSAPWIASHLHHILLWYIPGYILLGFGTAFIKWILYTLNRVSLIKEAKKQFNLQKIEKPDFKQGAHDYLLTEMYKKINNLVGNSKVENVTEAELAKTYEENWKKELPKLTRQKFVQFYKDGIRSGKFGKSSNHEIYDVDHLKETSIVDALAPRAKDNVGKITLWIFQWPIVITALLIEDLLVKLAKHFATLLDAMFSNIVRGMITRVTRGVNGIE